MNKFFISLVIPCYNEEKNIRLGALEKVSSFIMKSKYKWEVIIIDDGSDDESRLLIKDHIKGNPNFRLKTIHHKGKASAVMVGIMASRGDLVLFSDMDQATPISESDKLIRYITKGYDIIVGSRNDKREGAPFFRLLMARGFMALRNIILNLNIKDTQCGFKLFKKEAANEIFSKIKLYDIKDNTQGSKVTAGFDVEILYIAKVMGFKIKEVPVEWHYQETRRVNIIKDSLEGIIDLIKIRLNAVSGYYK